MIEWLNGRDRARSAPMTGTKRLHGVFDVDLAGLPSKISVP
jgi:hypothetical protein